MQTNSRQMRAPKAGIEIPVLDGRRREVKALRNAATMIESRLGTNPSFEGLQAAGAVLRLMAQIADLERKRTEKGPLSGTDLELLLRLENALARAVARLGRVAPTAREKSSPQKLAEYLASKGREPEVAT